MAGENANSCDLSPDISPHRKKGHDKFLLKTVATVGGSGLGGREKLL